MTCGKERRMLQALFLLLTLFVLASCGKQAPQTTADASSIWSTTRFTAEHMPLEAYYGIYGVDIQEDTVYLSTYLNPNKIQADLCVLNRSSGKIALLTGYDRYSCPPLTSKQKEGLDEVVRYAYDIFHIQLAGDQLWIMAGRQRIASSIDAVYANRLLLLKADPVDGTVTQEIRLDENRYTAMETSLCCDKQGNVYAFFGTGISVYDAGGNSLGQINAGAGKLVTLPDGRCGFLSDTMAGTQWQLRIIDPQTLSFSGDSLFHSTEQNALSKNFLKIFSGATHYDFLCSSDLSLYGCRIGQDGQVGTTEHILTWIDCDIDGTGIKMVRETEDGFLCVVSTEDFGPEIVGLCPRDPSDKDPEAITLACRELPQDVIRSVLWFNRQNPDIRVQIQDYGAISAKSGLAAGLDRFTTDLITGNVSDVFYTGNLDEQMLIDRGMLEDLWPWIDADEILGGREALVQPLFNAMSQNGKLYAVTDAFQVHTAIGYPDMVGDHEGWSVDELLQAYQSKENCRSIWYPYWDNRETMLEHMIAMCAESFIDRQNWIASYDSPAFIRQLEYLSYISKSFLKKEECESWLTDREQLVQSIYISNISKMTTAFVDHLQVMPFDGTMVGFPGVAGNGGAFVTENSMAMWSGSQHKEEAWRFLRSLLLPEHQRTLSWGIPSSKAVCEFQLRELTAEGILTRGGKCFDWIQEDTDRFWSYVEGITVVERTEENIATIIRDEAARFFAGQQTAEAAAKAIQSRVNLYLGERKQ